MTQFIVLERRRAQETYLQDSGIHTEHFAEFFWKCTEKNEIIISSYRYIGKWAIGQCNSIQYGALKEQSMPAARRHINWWSQRSTCTQCIYWRKGLPRKDSALISHQARRKKKNKMQLLDPLTLGCGVVFKWRRRSSSEK